MSTFKAKKELKSTIKRLEATGASKQEIGRVQYKLNQLMKEKAPRKITKRKTPLTGSPSAGTGKKVAKKKRGPDMYAEAVALGKPKGKGTGIVKSTAKAFAAPHAKIIDLSANKRAEQKKNDKGLEKSQRKGKGHPSAEMFAYVQNIGKKPSVKKKKK